MKKPDIKSALIGLVMLHTEYNNRKRKDPSIQNVATLILLEAIMNDLGYNFSTKFEIQEKCK